MRLNYQSNQHRSNFTKSNNDSARNFTKSNNDSARKVEIILHTIPLIRINKKKLHAILFSFQHSILHLKTSNQLHLSTFIHLDIKLIQFLQISTLKAFKYISIRNSASFIQKKVLNKGNVVFRFFGSIFFDYQWATQKKRLLDIRTAF